MQPSPWAWPSAPIVPGVMSVYVWQSACVVAFGAWPLIIAM
jgi:hypothetical protein